MRTYVKKSKYWLFRKANKHSMKLWKIVIILMAIFVAWAVINKWANKGPLVDPRCPAGFGKVEQVQASENPEPIKRLNVLYNFVRHHESNGGTKGLAVTCKNKGKINEIGYLLTPGHCFNNATDQEVTFKKWMSKRLNSGMSVQDALIIYTNNAPYAYTFR